MFLYVGGLSGDLLHLLRLADGEVAPLRGIQLNPRVQDDLVERQTLQTLLVQHPNYQVCTLVTHVGRQRPDSSIPHILQRARNIVRVGGVLERIDARDHQVEHHPHSPNINGSRVVHLLIVVWILVVDLPLVLLASVSQHLRRHVIGRSDPQCHCRLQVLRQTKVDDLQRVRLGVHHAVLGLQIPVAQAILMQERHSQVDLLEVVGCLLLRHPPVARVEKIQQVRPAH
mmetsp:Transcript_703/g.1840  ORF Transcript_703/g.1840 Transcript_703/m.1840 type:complete len:228 (-) Transcript_703:106-789(-)